MAVKTGDMEMSKCGTRGLTGGAHVHLRREKRPSEGLAEDGVLLEERVEEVAARGQLFL
jgi:hypothetical protein